MVGSAMDAANSTGVGDYHRLCVWRTPDPTERELCQRPTQPTTGLSSFCRCRAGRVPALDPPPLI
jgi:hypothetical protein